MNASRIDMKSFWKRGQMRIQLWTKRHSLSGLWCVPGFVIWRSFSLSASIWCPVCDIPFSYRELREVSTVWHGNLISRVHSIPFRTGLLCAVFDKASISTKSIPLMWLLQHILVLVGSNHYFIVLSHTFFGTIYKCWISAWTKPSFSLYNLSYSWSYLSITVIKTHSAYRASVNLICKEKRNTMGERPLLSPQNDAVTLSNCPQIMLHLTFDATLSSVVTLWKVWSPFGVHLSALRSKTKQFSQE